MRYGLVTDAWTDSEPLVIGSCLPFNYGTLKTNISLQFEATKIKYKVSKEENLFKLLENKTFIPRYTVKNTVLWQNRELWQIINKKILIGLVRCIQNLNERKSWS